MVKRSTDRTIIGKPPNAIMKKHLLNEWIKIFGSADVGDFETFISDVSDHSYSEAKRRLIQEYGSAQAKIDDWMEDYKKAQSLLDEFELESMEEVIRDLGEMGDVIIEKIRDDKQKISDLEREVELSKLKKQHHTTTKKKEAKPKPETKHGAEFDQVVAEIKDERTVETLLMLQDEITEGIYSLTKTDLKIIKGLIEQKRKELSEHEPDISVTELFPESKTPLSHATPSGPPPTTKDDEERRKRLEKRKTLHTEEQEYDEAADSEFLSTSITDARLSMRDAKRFLQKYTLFIPEMLDQGLERWLSTHPKAYTFPVTSNNISALSETMRRSRLPLPPEAEGPDMEAKRFLGRQSEIMFQEGYVHAIEVYDWDTWYRVVVKHMPNLTKKKFVNTVLNAAQSLVYTHYDFER